MKSEPVEGALDGHGAAVEDVGVDHRCLHVLVSEECLDGADVRAVFRKVGRKRVAEPMRCDPLGLVVTWARAAARRTARWIPLS